MSVQYGVTVGHFIKLPDDEIVEELYERFEDDFCNYGESLPNIILPNNSDHGQLFSGSVHSESEVVAFNTGDMENSYKQFKNGMSGILDFLDERKISYSIDFGAVGYFN